MGCNSDDTQDSNDHAHAPDGHTHAPDGHTHDPNDPQDPTIVEEIPIVRTLEVTDITTSGATIIGNVSYQGSSAVINHGVCWSTNNDPTILNEHTEQGSHSGNFTSTISSLNGRVDYYVRTYATNSEGTAYGETLNFRTLGAAPQAFTGIIEDNFPPNATLNGFVIPNLLTTSVYFEYSLTSDFQNPLESEAAEVTENGGVKKTITNLLPNTTYYYRFIAENEAGVSIGDTESFISQFAFGDYYNGGWVFHVDGTGLHGLVSTRDSYWHRLRVNWGPEGITGATDTALYTGDINSQKMLDLINPSSYQGYIVGRITLSTVGGNDDWHMASKDELNLIYQNLYLNGIAPSIFVGGITWSSSEVDVDSAWAQDFSTGSQFISGKFGVDAAVYGVSEF